jgi:hypothetical protein
MTTDVQKSRSAELQPQGHGRRGGGRPPAGMFEVVAQMADRRLKKKGIALLKVAARAQGDDSGAGDEDVPF